MTIRLHLPPKMMYQNPCEKSQKEDLLVGRVEKRLDQEQRSKISRALKEFAKEGRLPLRAKD